MLTISYVTQQRRHECSFHWLSHSKKGELNLPQDSDDKCYSDKSKVRHAGMPHGGDSNHFPLIAFYNTIVL